ncbi:hypothetical protein OIU77_023099, partial [Salix suchowensis]
MTCVYGKQRCTLWYYLLLSVQLEELLIPTP